MTVSSRISEASVQDQFGKFKNYRNICKKLVMDMKFQKTMPDEYLISQNDDVLEQGKFLPDAYVYFALSGLYRIESMQHDVRERQR